MTLSIMTFSIMTLRIMTLNIMTISINDNQHCGFNYETEPIVILSAEFLLLLC